MQRIEAVDGQTFKTAYDNLSCQREEVQVSLECILIKNIGMGSTIILITNLTSLFLGVLWFLTNINIVQIDFEDKSRKGLI